MNFKKIIALVAAFVIAFTTFISGGIDAYAAIAPGTKNSEVTAMQKKLIALGYLKDSADGSYGPATQTAVKSFESAQGLTADGKADDKMLAKLADIYNYTPSITFNSSSVNVRKGAGTSYATLGTVNKGASYKVLSSTVASGKTWYKFAYKETAAWVLGSYVDLSYGSSEKTGTLTSNSINARTGAGTSYSVYKVLNKGYNFKITGQKTVSGTTWYSFIYSGKTIWVSGKYVSVKESGSTETSTSTTASTTKSTTSSTTASTTASTTKSTAASEDVQYETIKKGTITGSTVNVRKGAGTNYSVVTTLKKGAVITITGSKKVSGTTWYSYKRNGSTVWVCGTYVKVTTTTVAVTTTTKATTSSTTISTTKSTSSTTASTTASTAANDYVTIKKGTITGSSVNVRKGAGTNYSVVTTLKKGAVITITGSKKVSGTTWYSYKRNGSTVWVCGTYVKVTSTTSIVTTTTTASTTESTTESTTSTTSTSGTTETSPSDIVSGSDATTSSTESTTSGTTESTTSSTEADDTENDYLYGVVDVNTTLNVRKTASSSASKLGALSDGAYVVIVDYTTKDGWYKIIYGSSYGWVSSDYIKLVDESEYKSEVEFTKSYFYVNEGKTKSIAIAGLNGVAYTSSNPESLPISSSGVVTGSKAGMYTVTAKFGSSVATTEVVVLAAEKTLTEEQQNMGISESGVKFIADWEGGGNTNPDILDGAVVVFEPYKDASGYWTIGYGHAVTTTASKSWSKATVIEYFATQIENYFGEEIVLSEEKPYLTKEEAQKLLMADLNKGTYVKAVRNWAVRNGVVLTQNEFDALVSFTYNMGTSYWTSDTKRFYLKSAIIAYRCGSDADPEQVTEGFSRYIRSGTKYLKGLYYRRMNEAEMFTDGDYGLERASKFPLPSGIKWS